jgi:hypothetical protein
MSPDSKNVWSVLGMAKAITTIKQVLNYQTDHAVWFTANEALFNRVATFYFEVIQAHEKVLDLSNKDALRALDMLTHIKKKKPTPAMPLSNIGEDIPAMFRRAAINAVLGSARSFYSHLTKWRKRKEKARAKGRKFTEHPPVPPRTWNMSATLYAGQWQKRTNSSILLKVWTGSYWQRLVARYHKSSQEKPPTPLLVERGEKSPGVVISQDAKSKEGPSIPSARYGDRNEHGTAQDVSLGMTEHISDIPRQLRLPCES